MAKIANVALTNTFDTWRIRSNQSFNRLSQFAINEAALYANTITANVNFVSLGNSKIGNSNTSVLIVNGLFNANGRIVAQQNLTVSGNSVFGASGKTMTITGLVSLTGRQTVSTNLTVSGNSTFGASGKTMSATGLLSLTGRQTISTNLTVSGNSTTSGIIHSTTGGFKYPDNAITTAPIYIYDSSGTQLYP